MESPGAHGVIAEASADMQSDPLSESRRWCRALLRREAKGFFRATRLLRRSEREAVEAIYGLFRTADDIADEPGPSREERVCMLDELAQTVRDIRAPSCESAAPWLLAVRDAFARYPIAIDDALRLIDACRSDAQGATIETYAELERYCACVAGTVGRCAMAILGASDVDSLERAERLGIALQLTNILRDVVRDRAIGRSYLPRDASADEIVRRARAYYEEAGVLARRLPDLRSRLAVLLAARLYARNLDRLPVPYG